MPGCRRGPAVGGTTTPPTMPRSTSSTSASVWVATIRMSPRSRGSTPVRGPPTSMWSWRSPGWPDAHARVHLDAVQVGTEFDLPVELGGRQCTPLVFGAGRDGRDVMGEDQDP